MLAQNFKSAEALGLTGAEHAALVKVLGMLERDELQYWPSARTAESPVQPEFTGHFNMLYWDELHACGTVACIGGTAELVGHLPRYSLFDTDDAELQALFFPDNMNEKTPSQAARALRAYLTTGQPDWSE